MPKKDMDFLQMFNRDINLQSLMNIVDPDSNLLMADEMMITRADGIILQVSKNYEDYFGFPRNSVVGRSAFDLEADGTFSPCVTAEVIRRKEKIFTIQTINRIHKNVITVGIPLFDNQGNLQYAICFNTVSMAQFNTIQHKYRDLQDSMKQYTRELEDLRTRQVKTTLIYRSPAMQKLMTLIQNTANTQANILITGETGVGKSAVAKTIHEISNRAAGPFAEINCAVLNENLIESELFGYEKGAYTGASSHGKIGKVEMANHGTLFLDEIGELPQRTQSKLLQLIQTKTIERLSSTRKIKVDFRLIVATNRDLEDEMKNGTFRPDLFYRLNVIRLQIPPLREREEDIFPLTRGFLDRFCTEYGKNVVFTPRLYTFLDQYSWPGNVRQLENLVERLVITAADTIVDTTALPQEYLSDGHAPAAETGTLAERMDAYEAEIIRSTYAHCKTTVALAKELGISQATAARKVAKYVG